MLQPALDDVVALFERIDVVAEGQQRGDVDGEPLEIVHDVDGLAGAAPRVPNGRAAVSPPIAAADRSRVDGVATAPPS